MHDDKKYVGNQNEKRKALNDKSVFLFDLSFAKISLSHEPPLPNRDETKNMEQTINTPSSATLNSNVLPFNNNN